MTTLHTSPTEEQIAAFCRKWGLSELSLFGSVLRDDFGADSDVDVLVQFQPGHTMTFENYLEMQDELSAMFGGRKIDLVEKRLIKNPFRRFEILTTRKVVYGSR
ncbi:MAG TPA: nucleotidyltransferase domain-containing protein [Phycisphaerae bacterium]|nr:nucleotidyltransferase domain-containing protein [Phycisphaerae bacterium]